MLAPNPTVQALQAARNLIADKTRWCQGHLREGDAHCAIGADLVARGISLIPADPRTSTHALASPELIRAAREMTRGDLDVDSSGYEHIWHVNDVLGHAAVMRLYDRAIQLAVAP